MEIEAYLGHGNNGLIVCKLIQFPEIRVAQRPVQILWMGAYGGEQRRICPGKSNGMYGARSRHAGDNYCANARRRGALQNAGKLRLFVLLNMGMNIDEQTASPGACQTPARRFIPLVSSAQPGHFNPLMISADPANLDTICIDLRHEWTVRYLLCSLACSPVRP